MPWTRADACELRSCQEKPDQNEPNRRNTIEHQVARGTRLDPLADHNRPRQTATNVNTVPVFGPRSGPDAGRPQNLTVLCGWDIRRRAGVRSSPRTVLVSRRYACPSWLAAELPGKSEKEWGFVALAKSS